METISWGSVITSLLAAIIGGFVSVSVGYFTFLNNDRGHDIRMVEIGLSMLRGEADMETARPARRFALELVQKYSGVEIDDLELWLDGGQTPFADINQAMEDVFAECRYLAVNRLSCMAEVTERYRLATDALNGAHDRTQSEAP